MRFTMNIQRRRVEIGGLYTQVVVINFCHANTRLATVIKGFSQVRASPMHTEITANTETNTTEKGLEIGY